MRSGLISAIASFVLLTAGFVPASAATLGGYGSDDGDYGERDEINETYALSPGATVTINDIAGPVEIGTTDGNQAEVHIVRSARRREDLAFKKIVVEHSDTSLAIHTEERREGRWDHVQVRQRVTLRLPLQVNLAVSDIAGRVRVGSVEGWLHINDVAGALTVDRVNGSPRINDIAGAVSLTVGEVGPDGIHLNDIAGRLELVITAGTNADLDISDISGQIDVGIPNVVVFGKIDPESFHGKIGGGGPQITINDIAGSVTVRN